MDVPDSARVGDDRQTPAEDLAAQELIWRLIIVNQEGMAFHAVVTRISKLKERTATDSERMKVLLRLVSDSQWEYHRIKRLLKDKFGIAPPNE